MTGLVLVLQLTTGFLKCSSCAPLMWQAQTAEESAVPPEISWSERDVCEGKLCELCTESEGSDSVFVPHYKRIIQTLSDTELTWNETVFGVIFLWFTFEYIFSMYNNYEFVFILVIFMSHLTNFLQFFQVVLLASFSLFWKKSGEFAQVLKG